MTVALVTDSTAYLPHELADALGVTVVPLQVTIDGVNHAEGVDLTDERLARLVRRARAMSTSRPSPRALTETYERLGEAGASAVVSVHLSGELSGTCDAARLAARSASIPVTVVDSRTMGMTLGHAVLDGARAARGGDDAEAVARVVAARARAGDLLFSVATLDFLRRGGRVGAAAAFFGTAFAMRPLLRLTDEGIVPVEKVRTTARALTRLVDLAGERAEAMDAPVAVTVHHLYEEERAERLAGRLVERLGHRLAEDDVRVRPIGAVAAVHLGPGALAVSLSPERPDTPDGG